MSAVGCWIRPRPGTSYRCREYTSRIVRASDDSCNNARVTADAAYDTVAVYETAGARGATVVIPPAKTATVSGHGPRSPARDRTITLVKTLGRRQWKEGVKGTIVRAGWRMRSSDTSPSSEMAFAPGAQPGRGVRWSSAAKSSIG